MSFSWPLRLPPSLSTARALSSSASRHALPPDSSSSQLTVAVIAGTTRTTGPPRPVLGPRVAQFVANALEQRGHEPRLVLPAEIDLPLLEKPHFAYAPGRAPARMQELYELLAASDAYVAVTPEYNHAPGPALLNVFNHFGSSTFGFKPSMIVSYSAGQWGGVRAAHSLRPILSELGCIPVSAMLHIPYAQDALDPEGAVVGDREQQQRWASYADRCLAQLEWWGVAAKSHRKQSDPFETSPPFVTSPKERNAP